jgi:hypothetical protein
MNVNSHLPVIDLLPVVYRQNLPERYVHSPVDKMCENKVSYDRQVTYSYDYCGKEECFRYGKDMRSNSGRVDVIASINVKGRYVDILA